MDMTRMLRVKICGLTSHADVAAALLAGADYLGFVFYPPSPRALGLEEARELAQHQGNYPDLEILKIQRA